MATLLLLHHELGITDAVTGLADAWRDAGHDVVVPDLFDGETFDDLDEGAEYARQVGAGAIAATAGDAAAALPSGFVVCGLSLGVESAMELAVDDDGVAAVAAVSACRSAESLPAPWPYVVPLRVLACRSDAIFRDWGGLRAARELAESQIDAKVKLLPGRTHLFMEADDPDSVAATNELYERVLRLLTRVDEDLPPGEADLDEEEDQIWDLP